MREVRNMKLNIKSHAENNYISWVLIAYVRDIKTKKHSEKVTLLIIKYNLFDMIEFPQRKTKKHIKTLYSSLLYIIAVVYQKLHSEKRRNI